MSEGGGLDCCRPSWHAGLGGMLPPMTCLLRTTRALRRACCRWSFPTSQPQSWSCQGPRSWVCRRSRWAGSVRGRFECGARGAGEWACSGGAPLSGNLQVSHRLGASVSAMRWFLAACHNHARHACSLTGLCPHTNAWCRLANRQLRVPCVQVPEPDTSKLGQFSLPKLPTELPSFEASSSCPSSCIKWAMGKLIPDIWQTWRWRHENHERCSRA